MQRQPATVQTVYDDWASSYDTDRNRTRDLDAQTIRALLVGQHFHRVIEAGCGTGKNTVWLSGQCDELIAFDFSENMLAQARQKVSATHVQFQQVDLTRIWPCADAWVDLVSFNLVLEHIEDLGAVFAQASRCLRPGGQLAISELHPFRQYEGTVANFQREDRTVQVPAFVHHLSDYFEAARANALDAVHVLEHWHADDDGKPPRLVSLEFTKQM